MTDKEQSNKSFSYIEDDNRYICTFEHDGLTFYAVMKLCCAENIRWMVSDQDKLYKVFRVFVIDPESHIVDCNYSWAERLLSDSEAFNIETMEKYVDAFLTAYPYMNLKKESTAVA